MQANPDKFQTIMLGKNGHDNCTSLIICGSEIKCEDSVKLLGVTIDFMLNFETHISNIHVRRKAARQINVLLRIGKYLSLETKILIYKSFIRSNFNYCPLVWNFCSKSSIDKLEKLQYRALRLVFNDFSSSYEALLEKANMPILHISRIRLIAIETFKILHKLSPVYLHDLVSYKESFYSFRYDNLVDLPRVRTTRYGKSTFCTIRPIYKNKGDVKNVENFSPITILSCLGKLFTALLNNRLTDFLDKNEQLLENQAGFRKGYGTTDHIFVLNSLIEIMKTTKKKLFFAFIDFSQAFDSIWRGGLWRKLLFNSMNGKCFKIVFNMFENIKSCVRINDETSAFFPRECGVRQGQNLSPLLFSLYLNDLETFITSGGVNSIDLEIISDEIHVYLKLLILLYADDTIIFSNDKENFQKALDNFHVYCNIWKLKVNLTKTNVIVFNSRTNRNMSFTLRGGGGGKLLP